MTRLEMYHDLGNLDWVDLSILATCADAGVRVRKEHRNGMFYVSLDDQGIVGLNKPLSMVSTIRQAIKTADYYRRYFKR